MLLAALMVFYCANNILFKKLAEHFYIKEIKTNYAAAQNQIQDGFLGKNMLMLSFAEIQNQIQETLDGKYSNLRLKKILPSSLQIEIIINPPVAYKITTNKQKLFFDSYGSITYKTDDSDQFSNDNLMQLSGKEVEFNFVEIMGLIKSIDGIECSKLEFIDERRWDLHLKNGVVIKLSKKNYSNTFLFLQKIINKRNLMNEVAIIDLRFYPRKIFVTNK